jgi:hypothetical protein
MSDAPAKDAPSTPSTTSAPAATTSTAVVPASKSAPAATDVVLLGPPTADGAGVHVLRAREERLEVGELRALQEGRPITGEVVTLSPRKDNPRVCDVTESYAPPTTHHKGPAKVATPAYREGWDEIFGKKAPVPGPLN